MDVAIRRAKLKTFFMHGWVHTIVCAATYLIVIMVRMDTNSDSADNPHPMYETKSRACGAMISSSRNDWKTK